MGVWGLVSGRGGGLILGWGVWGKRGGVRWSRWLYWVDGLG